jgi:hypothetical protein
MVRDSNSYRDLLFYHLKLRCFVVKSLKGNVPSIEKIESEFGLEKSP